MSRKHVTDQNRRNYGVNPDRKEKLTLIIPEVNDTDDQPTSNGLGKRLDDLDGTPGTPVSLGYASTYSRKYSTALKTLKPFRPSSSDGKIPVNKVGFFSYVTLSWITSLVLRIYRHRDEPLKEEDVWECSEWETCAVNTDRVERIWAEELKARGREKSSFLRVWLKFIQTRLYIKVLAICVNASLTFLMTGYITDLVVGYLEAETSDVGYAVGILAANIIGQVLRAMSFCFLIFFGIQTGVRFRAGVLGAVYKKIMKLQSIKGKLAAEAVTIFGADALRMYVNCVAFVFLLAVPAYVTIATVYTYILIGPWCFIALGVFLVFYQIQAQLTTLVAKLRKNTLVHTDKRVRKMTEVLTSMKMVKMYAWEDSFQKSITDLRKKEIRLVRFAAILNSITMAVIPITPSIASVSTIAAYRYFENELTASKAFALVTTMEFLRAIISSVPFAIRFFGEARIAFKRVKNILLKDEFSPPSCVVHDNENAVEIEKGVFQWNVLSDSHKEKEEAKKVEKKMKKKKTEDEIPLKNSSAGLLLLDGIDFSVKKGQLIGICGSVGCGKSSLMSAILGRMPRRDGHLAVAGSVAYAAQQAWIFSGTLRENILFGKPYDPTWYKEVVYACGLEPDLDLMVNRDETEIGERGINISGGQKQRLSLARAVYSRSDIYLLDDPLSAVDVHVGRHLFHKCIKKLLTGKTVILATHQLQYLKHCDEIVVMEEGKITERGSHETLMEYDGYYGQMIGQFHKTTSYAGNKENETVILDGNNGPDQKSSQADQKTANGKEETSKPSAERKGQLTKKEEVDVGEISHGTYKSYMYAAGGVTLTIIILLMYIVSMGSGVFANWWLGIWVEHTTTLSRTKLGPTSNVSYVNYGSYNSSTPEMWSASLTEMQNQNTTASPTEKKDQEVDIYLTVYLSSMVAILVLTSIKGMTASSVMVRASQVLHNRALHNVMRAPMTFFDSNPTGRILNRFTRDLDEADVMIPHLLDALLQILFLIILSLIAAVVNLPWILIAMVPVAVVYYLFKKISVASTRQFKRFENIARSPLINHVSVSGQGLDTIVAFNQQKQFISNCMKYTDVTTTGLFLFEASMRWLELRLDIAASLMTVAASIAMICSKGLISPAFAALALSLCIRVVTVMQYIVRVMNETEARFTSVERIHEYEKKLEIERDTISGFTPEDSWPNEGSVVFSEVLMRYRDDMDPVLKNINFEIKPKQKVGIVGRTGAGKSSLATALFRLRDLSDGHIYLDGTDIATIPRKLLRSNLSTIPQDPVLFSGTLRYNLDPFNKYTDETIWSALEQVHMKEKVRQFEQQLDFIVEENGENFSVGERQLICLARAILRKNKVLLLDEATASIDTATDAMIQQTIRDSFSDCTVLTIAHRLNTVLHCDFILIMEAGEVLETGAPQDLLSNPLSVFNKMIHAQTVKTPSP